MKKYRGITLIALVITIIIILILASVSINLIIGQNGLINRAKEAKIQAEIASIKEEIQIDIIGKQAENEGNITEDTLKETLEKYGILSTTEEKLTDKTLTTTQGNYEIKVSELFNGITIKNDPKEPIFTTVANKPDISQFNESKTYYVSWDLTNAPYTIDDTTLISDIAPSNWYDYTAGVNHWANIKTTGGGNDCYWVWIPRYAYKVPTKIDGEGRIEVKFLQGKSNIPIGETDEITNLVPTKDEWVVHPAFTNTGNGGFEELTGIWVAKFEASSSNVSETTVLSDLETTGGENVTNLQIRVKPNVTSWRGITIENAFKVCRNLTLVGNSLENTTNLNSHLIKNTEWGAIAYLSRSRYGKDSKVWNNPYYKDNSSYSPITGLCGKGTNDKNLSTTDINKTCKYNEISGGNASTTGNVYGIYDMSGGSWEYVAGILKDYKSNSDRYDFSNSDIYQNKYFDWYDGNSSDRNTNYNVNTRKYGDAVYETSNSGNSLDRKSVV